MVVVMIGGVSITLFVVVVVVVVSGGGGVDRGCFHYSFCCCFCCCWERKIPCSNPACAGIFSGSSHTSDF